MKSKALRLALVLVALGAIAVAGFFAHRVERQNAAVRRGQAALESDAARVHTLLADLRAGLPAYVSPGQGLGYWTERNEGLLESLAAAVTGLERPGTVAAASQEIGTLEESVVMLSEYNGRIRLLLQNDQASDAAHLVFSDAGELARTARDALTRAVIVQRQAADAEISRREQVQAYALGGAAVLAAGVLLLLLPAPAAREERRELVGAAGTAATVHDLSGLGLDGPASALSLGRSGFDLDMRPAAAVGPAAPRETRDDRSASLVPGPAPAAGPAAPSTIDRHSLVAHPSPAANSADAEPAPRPDFAETARLCTELAQVADTSQLRPLLGRAAELLHASGIVIWLGGTNGKRLRPAFSHGYPQPALARMQAVEKDDENAVSAAYRTATLQVVEAGNEGTSALVMPLLAPSGCVGAMAVEVCRGAEKDPGVRAIGQLVAAQIATLMPTEA